MFQTQFNDETNDTTNNEIALEQEPTTTKAKKTASFADFNLNATVANTLNALNLMSPTPIQQAAIPVMQQGHDILASAQTGSGKTIAFVLPLLEKLLKTVPDSKIKRNLNPPQALILVPTRELGIQIQEQIYKLTANTSLKSVVLYGGEPIRQQIKRLRMGCDIIISTLGRLCDHLNSGTISLTAVNTLVLDEADRILDMGFLPDLEYITKFLPKESLQTVLFSATFSMSIKKLASQFLKDPQTIQIAAEKKIIEQKLYTIHNHQRLEMAKNILDNHEGQCIIFTNSKQECRDLVFALKRDFTVTTIHGDLAQNERLKYLNRFKKQEVRILVATDVAARGLDIPALPLVINYRLPLDPENYIHRIGRTGRAGIAGKAFSLCEPSSETNLYFAIERFTKEKLEAATPILEGTPVFNSQKGQGGGQGRGRSSGGGGGRGRSSGGFTPRNNSVSASFTDGGQRGDRNDRSDRGSRSYGNNDGSSSSYGRSSGERSYQPREDRGDRQDRFPRDASREGYVKPAFANDDRKPFNRDDRARTDRSSSDRGSFKPEGRRSFDRDAQPTSYESRSFKDYDKQPYGDRSARSDRGSSYGKPAGSFTGQKRRYDDKPVGSYAQEPRNSDVTVIRKKTAKPGFGAALLGDGSDS